MKIVLFWTILWRWFQKQSLAVHEVCVALETYIHIDAEDEEGVRLPETRTGKKSKAIPLVVDGIAVRCFTCCCNVRKPNGKNVDLDHPVFVALCIGKTDACLEANHQFLCGGCRTLCMGGCTVWKVLYHISKRLSKEI